ncbi:MAG: SDR family NAD(P)-dependent oxidoreductase, partial [Candidatus Vogelbacteria bacterium]|nr:SDR family NAD(P)-dependent oxidoreductase [Candidatus Vogelbacteria bacterium]
MNQERAIILGGTRGLGRAIAVKLISRGIEPLIIGRSVPKEGDSSLPGAVFIPGDLKNEDIGDLIR